MTKILQYSPWCKLYIVTDRPWAKSMKEQKEKEAKDKAKEIIYRTQKEAKRNPSEEELYKLFDPGMEERIYDVTKDIISGSVSLKLNQISTLTVMLANPNGKYLNVFMPNDRVMLFMKRDKPIQVFSGYLDSVPAITARKKEAVTLTASCNLKKLNNTFWNSYLHYMQAFDQGKLDPLATPDKLLEYLVIDVGGFDPVDVYIQEFKDIDFWNQLVQQSLRGTNLSVSGAGNIFGIMTPSTGGDELRKNNIDPIKLTAYLSEKKSPLAPYAPAYCTAGTQFNVNPALIIAMAGSETSFGKDSNACCNNGANYNYWGIKYNDFDAKNFGAVRSLKPAPEGGYYCSYPNPQRGAASCASLLSRNYLNPNGSCYVDGTIRGISCYWVNGSKNNPSESWTQRVETFYKEIMQKCQKNQPSPQAPEEEQRALRERSIQGGTSNPTGYKVTPTVDGGVFPVPSNYNYSYSNDWGEPRSVGRTHKGNDIFADRGTPAVAVYSGTVTFHEGGNAGKYIKLTVDNGGGTFFYYMHMDGFAPGLTDGSKVRVGQVIGLVGDTGNAKGTPCHIHFELHPGGGGPENPYSWLVAHDPQKTGGAGSTIVPTNFQGDLGFASGLNYIDLTGQLRSVGTLSLLMYGVYALAVTDRLLKEIFEVAKYGLYVITTDGTGRFIARWADFFGTETDAEGKSGPHFRIEDIEIIDFTANVDDTNLVTHQFVVPDSYWDGEITIDDWLIAGAGGMNDAVSNAVQSITAGDNSLSNYLTIMPEYGIAVTSLVSDRVGIFNNSDWTPEEFIEKYGYRPAVDESLICSNKAQAQFLSEYIFKEKWANLVKANLQTTFLPEIRPAMIVEIPCVKMQFFVESVTHQFGTKFGTSINLKAGLFLDEKGGTKNPFMSKIIKVPIGISLAERPLGIPGKATEKESGQFDFFQPEDLEYWGG